MLLCNIVKMSYDWLFPQIIRIFVRFHENSFFQIKSKAVYSRLAKKEAKVNSFIKKIWTFWEAFSEKYWNGLWITIKWRFSKLIEIGLRSYLFVQIWQKSSKGQVSEMADEKFPIAMVSWDDLSVNTLFLSSQLATG